MIRSLTPEELVDLAGGEQDAGFGALDTEKGCLPLRSLDVDVRIDGLSAATTVRQRFANVFAEPLEATYVFPLPPRAAVTGFTMTVGGAEIHGRIDERAGARRDYAAAVAEGRHAAIVEEERPDVFTLRVGNIPPRSIARVEFTLVAPVTIDSLEATYRFPLVVAPRYCPGTAIDGDQVGDGVVADTDLVPDASRISPPILLPGMKSPVRLGITVHVAASAITEWAASVPDPVGCSLPAEETIDAAGNREITVVPDQRLDRDFILRWKLGSERVAMASTHIEPDALRPAGLGTAAAVADAPGEGTFAVTIVPPAAAVATVMPRDVIFVLDRSGSMKGWKMTAARRAVARMIDSLTNRDRVAVLAFDDRMEHCGDTLELAWASDRNRWRLLEWLGTVAARGGTQLGAALSTGLGLCGTVAGPPMPASAPSRDRYVVLVTDGQVGDEDRVLHAVAKKLGGTRLFVVGIDNAVNEGLLSRLADVSGGLVELVESEDRLDEVMDRIHARIAAPLVTELRIMGDGIELIPESIVPGRIPDLVAGVPLVLRGRYRAASSAGGIRIEGRQAEGAAWQATAPILPATPHGLGSLWARGLLRKFEDLRVTSEASAHDPHDEPQKGAVADRFEARIVAVSTSFGVLCRFTALVAIDDRRPNSRLGHAPPRRIVQPVHTRSRILYSRSFPSLAAPLSVPASPPSDSYSLLCEDNPSDRDGGWMTPADSARASADPLAKQRGEAARLVVRTRPRSGAVADVTPAKVRTLLRGVLRLVKHLGAKAAPVELLERLRAAHARLEAMPADLAALEALLELLAGFVEEAHQIVRWWGTPTGDLW